MTTELQGPPMKLAICVPHTQQVDAEFAVSLARLSASLGATLIADGIADAEIFTESQPIEIGRQRLAARALLWGATHLLWIDSDMIFPAHALHRLVTRLNADVDIVGCAYPARRYPHAMTAFAAEPTEGDPESGKRLRITEESTGIVPVDILGFGLVLMKASVLGKVKSPGFLFEWRSQTGSWAGEDVFFCRQARAAGVTLYVDADLSKEIGHAGRMVFTAQHAEAMVEDTDAPRILTVDDVPDAIRQLQRTPG